MAGEWPPRVERAEGLLKVNLGGSWLVASTGVDGGLRRARYVVVARSNGSGDPWGEAREALERAGVEPGEAVTLLTAVEPSKAVTAAGSEAFAAVTAGLSSPACVGGERFEAPSVSTINVVAAVRRPLTEAGLLDLLRAVAEAKAAAARDLGLWCGSSGPPLGTVSDAIAVAAPLGGGGHPWSGPATVHGGEAAELVYRLVLEADGRSEGERLRGLIGVGPEELVGDAVKAYSTAPVPGVEPGEFEGLVRRVLEEALGDPNVWALLAAARGAHEYMRAWMEGYRGDPRGLVADELLGAAAALYVNGWRGLLAAYWLDRSKERLGLTIAGLPPAMDDAAAGLLGGVYSRVLDGLSGGRPWRRQR